MTGHEKSESGSPRLLLPAALGVLVLAALLFAILASKGGSKHESTGGNSSQVQQAAEASVSPGGFVGAEIPGDRTAAPIDLTDQYGSRVSLAQFRGQPVIVSFVYTRCGAQCKVIAQQIRGALNELAHPVPVILVSVDPQDDTPAAVRGFLASMSLAGRVYYLTGAVAQLAPIWRAYRIKPATAGLREFETSASVVLVDRSGVERVLYSLEQLTPEAIAHDVEKLQSH